jgi:hypothetical protein
MVPKRRALNPEALTMVHIQVYLGHGPGTRSTCPYNKSPITNQYSKALYNPKALYRWTPHTDPNTFKTQH